MARKPPAQIQREINAALARSPTQKRSSAALGQSRTRAHATKREEFRETGKKNISRIDRALATAQEQVEKFSFGAAAAIGAQIMRNLAELRRELEHDMVEIARIFK